MFTIQKTLWLIYRVANIVVGGAVQDEFQFPNNFVLKTSNKTQVVSGEKRFVGPVRSGSLKVANLVNDIENYRLDKQWCRI